MKTIGIDEVGRGCWAGPLVACAVLWEGELPDAVRIGDSKVLGKKQREAADAWIHEHTSAIGVGWVAAAEVDSLGMTEAVRTAMRRAVAYITEPYDEIVIDGNINYLAENPKARAVIKADGSVPAVSMASIVAKVARDNYMASLPEEYAGYGFEKHVGYGTKVHQEALMSLGVSDLHRKSFKPIKALL